MERVDNYLVILAESLRKKSKILDGIRVENARQLKAMKADPIDYETFEDTMSKKEVYIEQLNQMDDAFQKVFDRIKEGLDKEKTQYAEQIAEMKQLIREVTDKAMNVQAEETRNKEAFANAVLNERQKVKSVKTAQKVATGYYESMKQLNALEPQFMDTKK